MKTLFRRHKVLLLSVLLGFCAFVSSYGALRGYLRSGPVVVAARDCEPYTGLAPGDVILAEVPASGIPRGALTAVSQVVGHYTRTRLVAGQMVLSGHITQDVGEAGLSYDLPQDSRGIFLPAPASRALGGMLRAGERVDVIVVQKGLAYSYGEALSPAFTAFSELLVREVVVDEGSGEFLGVIVLASQVDCEAIAQHLEHATLYLTLVPRT